MVLLEAGGYESDDRSWAATIEVLDISAVSDDGDDRGGGTRLRVTSGRRNPDCLRMNEDPGPGMSGRARSTRRRVLSRTAASLQCLRVVGGGRQSTAHKVRHSAVRVNRFV